MIHKVVTHVVINVAGLAVPFIDVDHLVANKRASGRLQDLADVEALTEGGARTAE